MLYNTCCSFIADKIVLLFVRHFVHLVFTVTDIHHIGNVPEICR